MKIVKKVSFSVAVMLAAVHASSQILSVDFETNALYRTQSGFTHMGVSDQTSLVTSQSIGGYTVRIAGGYSNSCFSGGQVLAYNERTRANNITNAGAFTQGDLMRERVVVHTIAPVDPATGFGTGPGLYLMVEGLAPNQTYTIRVWGVDHHKTLSQLKPGYAYGFNATFETNGYTSLPQIGTYTVVGTPTTITDNNQYSVSGNITSDYQGRIIYKSISNIDGCGLVNGFTLTVVGEPAEGYNAWGNSWGLNIGSETNDYDGDLANNFYEYAFNGNPTNALDQGEMPFIEDFSSTKEYSHLARNDSPNITYTVQVKTNLMDEVWNNSGYTPVVVGSEGAYNRVNYVIPFTNQNYIRVLVEEP